MSNLFFGFLLKGKDFILLGYSHTQFYWLVSNLNFIILISLTKIRYYFHSVKSFFKYFFLEIVWVSFITYGLSIIQIYKELFILSNLFLIRVRSPFMLSVLLNLLQRSILFIHSVCSAFLSQGNNIFAVRTGFEPVIYL